MFYIRCSVQFELVENCQRVILDAIEIAVIAAAWNKIPVFGVPFSMLYSDILCRNHLAVEHSFLCTESLILCFYQSKYSLYKLLIVLIRCDVKSHEFCCFYKTIDTNSEILAINVDVSSIKEWKHVITQQLLEVFIVC